MSKGQDLSKNSNSVHVQHQMSTICVGKKWKVEMLSLLNHIQMKHCVVPEKQFSTAGSHIACPKFK